MSSAHATSTPTQSRRFHARRRIDGLIYVDFGPDNGAILIDLGEGGLGFQSVVPISLDQALLLKFKVPGDTNPIEGYAEVAWLNESGKGGGLRFVELSENARAQIRGWTGSLTAPEPIVADAASGAEPPAALEGPAEVSSATAETSKAPRDVASPDTNLATKHDTPVQSSEAFDAGNAQPPSPQISESETNTADQEPLHSSEAAHEHVAASEDFWPGQSLLAEFVAGLPLAVGTTEKAAAPSEPAPPISATVAADRSASESALPREDQDAHDLSASEESAGGSSEIPEATADSEPIVEPHPNSEIAAPLRNAARPEVSTTLSGTPEDIPRAHEFTPEIPHPLTTLSAKPARPQPAEAKNLASPPKRERKPASSKADPSRPSAYRQDSAARGSFARPPAKPASIGSEGESSLQNPGDGKAQSALSSQAFKIGIGAAAGAALVLALVFAVPSFRTLVQTTANARSAGLNPANAPAFQVEVADLDNRRWILRSGGDAGSPFGDTPSRQPSASSTARKESAKSRSDDSDASTEAVAAPQPKQANPAELALSRPVAKPTDTPDAQLVAPSIFDGITPPVGSLTDRLPASGPDMPGIVQPASPANSRPSALQSAVLVQRVAPVYPVGALQAKVQGEVSVNATIGTDGVPKDLKLIKGDQRLVAAAFAAIRQWRYRPATLGGAPIETQTAVTVSFELK